jgi:polysaccharide lyase-like protein
MSRRARVFLSLMIGAALVSSRAVPAGARRGVWFCGDFETGGLQGWSGDFARAERAEVVTAPVRKGRYAVRITLAPGDIAASKERAELKVGDKRIERVHGSQGGEMWYGWSLLIPTDYADPPGDQFQILAQWHQQPDRALPGERPKRMGPPPLTLHLVTDAGRHVLLLIGQASSTGAPRTLGARPIRLGTWIDLVFHIRWSTGRDGFVEAWLDGRPFTGGKKYEPTLYSPVSNYLRLGLYRGKGVPTVNRVYYDEVRLGDSYQAVAP